MLFASADFQWVFPVVCEDGQSASRTEYNSPLGSNGRHSNARHEVRGPSRGRVLVGLRHGVSPRLLPNGQSSPTCRPWAGLHAPALSASIRSASDLTSPSMSVTQLPSPWVE